MGPKLEQWNTDLGFERKPPWFGSFFFSRDYPYFESLYKVCAFLSAILSRFWRHGVSQFDHSFVRSPSFSRIQPNLQRFRQLISSPLTRYSRNVWFDLFNNNLLPSSMFNCNPELGPVVRTAILWHFHIYVKHFSQNSPLLANLFGYFVSPRSEVKPPAALLRFDDDQERRVKEAEDLAAQRTWGCC